MTKPYKFNVPDIPHEFEFKTRYIDWVSFVTPVNTRRENVVALPLDKIPGGGRQDRIFYWGGISMNPTPPTPADGDTLYMDTGAIIDFSGGAPVWNAIVANDCRFDGTAAAVQYYGVAPNIHKIFIVGGVQYTPPPPNKVFTISANILVYDIIANSWGTVNFPAGFAARVNPFVCVLPGARLLIAGGYDVDSNILPDSKIYDVITDTWYDCTIPLGIGIANPQVFRFGEYDPPDKESADIDAEVFQALTGANTITEFTNTVTKLYPIRYTLLGSTTIGGAYTFSDDGAGNIIDVSSDIIGTINYDTGEITITFPAAPTTDILIDYRTSIEELMIISNHHPDVRQLSARIFYFNTWRNEWVELTDDNTTDLDDAPERRESPVMTLPALIGTLTDTYLNLVLGGRFIDEPFVNIDLLWNENTTPRQFEIRSQDPNPVPSPQYGFYGNTDMELEGTTKAHFVLGGIVRKRLQNFRIYAAENSNEVLYGALEDSGGNLRIDNDELYEVRPSSGGVYLPIIYDNPIFMLYDGTDVFIVIIGGHKSYKLNPYIPVASSPSDFDFNELLYYAKISTLSPSP